MKSQYRATRCYTIIIQLLYYFVLCYVILYYTILYYIASWCICFFLFDILCIRSFTLWYDEQVVCWEQVKVGHQVGCQLSISRHCTTEEAILAASVTVLQAVHLLARKVKTNGNDLTLWADWPLWNGSSNTHLFCLSSVSLFNFQVTIYWNEA